MREDLVKVYKRLRDFSEMSAMLEGDLHLAFIEIKVNSTWNDFESIITEIERGGTVYISDYKKTLREIKIPLYLITMLIDQKVIEENKSGNLVQLKEEDI